MHSCLSPIHTASAERERGSSGARGDRRIPTSCTAAPADARYVSGPRLTPLGRSSTICRPCSAAHLGIQFRQGIAHPAERQLPPCLSAEAPAGRYRWSCCIHRPCHSAPRGSPAANLVARHSTPNSTARRPAPTVSRATPAHRSGGAATTPQCRPARVRPLKYLLLRPSNRRADLQPLRALPPRATSSALQTVPPALRLTRASRALDFVFLPRSRV